MLRRTLFALGLLALAGPATAGEPPPLKALLVTGGCCHDYKGQVKILTEGVRARARVEWTVFGGDQERETKLDLYLRDDWGGGYDVVVHNECYGSVKDAEYVERIARAHAGGLPAVVIHCSMHSYRDAPTDEWRRCLGVTSRRHEGHRSLAVKVLERDHPVLASFPDTWETPNGELYVIEKVWPQATPLAQAYGTDTGRDHVVVWTNTCGKARVFGTTLGHHNETMAHEVYLDMITRGLLWACGKLGDDGTPAPGYAAGSWRREETEPRAATTRILLIGHQPDHPHGTHMYLHECRLLARCLEQTPGVEAVVSDGWPRDPGVLAGVRAIVLYTSPGGDLLLGGPHRTAAEALLRGGAGLTAIHWATGDSDLERGPQYLALLGGWFHTKFSGLKTTAARLLQADPAHPACRGWKEYELRDEFYLDLRFLPAARPLFEVELDGRKQIVGWAYEREGGGRSFGTTLGHFHDNFILEPFRRAIVNGILWTAGLEVPEGGAPCAIGPGERELPPAPAKAR